MSAAISGVSHFPHIALMSFVKWFERELSPPCDFAGGYGRDDRATVEAKPEDVGDQALIRVFNRSSEISSGAVLSLRAGVDLLIGHKATSGIPLPWLRPRRCTIFVRIAARVLAPCQAC
jgi:hypothetical protein